jgi:AcrR family transcriptional regulator
MEPAPSRSARIAPSAPGTSIPRHYDPSVSRGSASPRGRKVGRRPGETQTREAILRAARAEFAEHGAGATVRSIASAAGVDPALVIHFYRTKDDLFVEAMQWPFDFDHAVREIVAGPRSRIGQRLADFFLSIWDHPEQREPVIGLLRAATTSAQAGELLRDALGRRLLEPIGERLDRPDAALRMNLCGAALVGLGTARYIVKVEPLASMEPSAVAALIAPTLQRYLTGRLPEQ